MATPIQDLSQIISAANVCYIVMDTKSEEVDDVQTMHHAQGRF